ncbi:MAG: hypothetical protein AAB895_01550, partial [Patescibacteria group bacterium]
LSISDLPMSRQSLDYLYPVVNVCVSFSESLRLRLKSTIHGANRFQRIVSQLTLSFSLAYRPRCLPSLCILVIESTRAIRGGHQSIGISLRTLSFIQH